jgi:hypothetical protein
MDMTVWSRSGQLLTTTDIWFEATNTQDPPQRLRSKLTLLEGEDKGSVFYNVVGALKEIGVVLLVEHRGEEFELSIRVEADVKKKDIRFEVDMGWDAHEFSRYLSAVVVGLL